MYCAALLTFVSFHCVFLLAAGTQAAVSATITDLGTLGCGFSDATAINNAGEIVGYSCSTFNEHAFLYSGGVMTDLGVLNSSSSVAFSQTLSINSAGQIAGVSSYADDTNATHAFLYSGGAMNDLGTLDGGAQSLAVGINSSGQIAGQSYTTNNVERAFLYSGGIMTDLGTLGGASSGANGINDAGQIVGFSYTSSDIWHAFLYSGGSMTDIGALAGNFDKSEATGINDARQVVGYVYVPDNSIEYAFLYSGGVLTDLGTLGCPFNQAAAINAAGQVVGASCTATEPAVAFLYSGGVMTDLDSFLPANSGWQLEFANAINDSGQIVGEGILDGETRAFLLDTANSAAPEPASCALLSTSVALLMLRRSRQPMRA